MNIGTHFSGQPMYGQLIDLLSKRYSIRDVVKLSGKSVSTVQPITAIILLVLRSFQRKGLCNSGLKAKSTTFAYNNK